MAVLAFGGGARFGLLVEVATRRFSLVFTALVGRVPHAAGPCAPPRVGIAEVRTRGRGRRAGTGSLVAAALVGLAVLTPFCGARSGLLVEVATRRCGVTVTAEGYGRSVVS